jgi:hypothetical protein
LTAGRPGAVRLALGSIGALVLVAGCGGAPHGAVAATRFREGDRIVYRYDGEALEAPVELEERIVEVDGLRLRIAVTARRGDEVRRWVQLVTDTAENRESNHVDRLYALDEDGTEHLLENEGGEDLRELYGWTLPDVEWGTPGDEVVTNETRTFAGATYACAIGRTPLPSVGEHAVIELSDCADLVWTHGPGHLRDGERTLWSVDVLELGAD